MTDYKKLWEELIDELGYLINQDVRELHPQIVLEFMNFMQHREEAKEHETSGHR
jgi:hypothetical protein